MNAPPANGIFSRGQLTSLIFLTMGLSRLLQVSNAIPKETQGDDGSVLSLTASHTCMSFFNGTAMDEDPASMCLDEGLNALLKYKYALGWQVTVLVFSVMLQCWNRDEWLIRLNVGFLVTPILASMLALLSVEETLIHKGSARQQVIMAVVLSCVGAPPSVDWIPFLGGTNNLPGSVPRGSKSKSLQSLMIMTMACYFFFQGVVQWGYPLVPSYIQLWSAENLDSAASVGMEWVNKEVITAVTKTPASLVVMLFMIIDKLTLAFLFFFAWFYLPEQQQRTLLLYTAVVHFVSGTYQWPWLENQVIDNSNHRMVDFTIAGFGLLAWILPPLIWKKKVG